MVYLEKEDEEQLKWIGLYFEIPSFNIFSDLSKIAMSIGMLLGRLEIYPMIVLLLSGRKS